MTSQALYRKWRSQTFDEVIGQQHVTQTLINALKLDRVAHAYLFSGPRGTGKTSTARLLAKAVNCLDENLDNRPCNVCAICTAVNEARLMDLIEIDAASNTGVDDIRDLRDKVGFRPAEAKIKFYIIDEVHMLSNSAFNALLKTLEEPPAHVIFVLATTEPEKIPATITSRCQRFDFKRIKMEDVANRLNHIITQEGFTADKSALEFIARQGSGSMRDAISLLDQMVAYGGETISLELVQDVLGAVASQSVISLVDSLIDHDIASGLDIINEVVSDGIDPRQFAREMVEYLRAVMLVKLGNGAEMLNLPEETLVAVKAQADRTEAAPIVRATDRFNKAQIDIKSGLLAIPQLPLELAFVEAATKVVPTKVTPAPVASAPMAKSPVAKPVPTTMVPQSTPMSAAVAPVQPVAQESDSLTVAMVKQHLGAVIALIEPKSKPMAEALRGAALYQVDGNAIHFITFELMKERFDKPQPKKAIDNAFSQVFGRSVAVHFISDTAISSSEVPTDSDKQNQADNTTVLLKVATEELGGEIIE